MKYWHDEKYVAEHHISECMIHIALGFPATKGTVQNDNGDILEYFEIEIIPGSFRQDVYYSPYTQKEGIENLVDAVSRYKYTESAGWTEQVVTLPIQAFGLTHIPNNYEDAYARAMKCVY